MANADFSVSADFQQIPPGTLPKDILIDTIFQLKIPGHANSTDVHIKK